MLIWYIPLKSGLFKDRDQASCRILSFFPIQGPSSMQSIFVDWLIRLDQVSLSTRPPQVPNRFTGNGLTWPSAPLRFLLLSPSFALDSSNMNLVLLLQLLQRVSMQITKRYLTCPLTNTSDPLVLWLEDTKGCLLWLQTVQCQL